MPAHQGAPCKCRSHCWSQPAWTTEGMCSGNTLCNTGGVLGLRALQHCATVFGALTQFLRKKLFRKWNHKKQIAKPPDIHATVNYLMWEWPLHCFNVLLGLAQQGHFILSRTLSLQQRNNKLVTFVGAFNTSLNPELIFPPIQNQQMFKVHLMPHAYVFCRRGGYRRNILTWTSRCQQLQSQSVCRRPNETVSRKSHTHVVCVCARASQTVDNDELLLAAKTITANTVATNLWHTAIQITAFPCRCPRNFEPGGLRVRPWRIRQMSIGKCRRLKLSVDSGKYMCGGFHWFLFCRNDTNFALVAKHL